MYVLQVYVFILYLPFADIYRQPDNESAKASCYNC